MNGTFDDRTLAALKAGIRHWEKNTKAATARARGVGVGNSSCALCRLFLKRRVPCDGCPVKERLGVPYCKHAIWQEASDTYDKWFMYYYVNPTVSDELMQEAKEKFHLAAQAELEFLISLLPKESAI